MRVDYDLILNSMAETMMMSGGPITWIHKDGRLVFGRIHSHSLQLRPFSIPAFDKLLLKLPVCLVLHATSLVIYEGTLLLDERPCYSLCNSLEFTQPFRVLGEEFATREMTT